MVDCDSMNIQCKVVSVPPSSMRSKLRNRLGSAPSFSLFT